jgi:glycosyltransferase involved in cell wall biosynthesis
VQPSPRPLRVLTLIDRPITTGGGERMASLIAMSLDRQRFRPYVCSSRPLQGPTFAAELEAANVPVLALPRRSKLHVAAWRRLHSFLRHERIDVLHAHKFGSNVWGTLLGRLARVPVVIAHEHSWSYEGQPLRRFLDRELVGRGADAFVAVSERDRTRMVGVEGVRPRAIRLLPNGIPPQERSGTDVRAELGIPPDAFVVGTVAQLRPEKALDVLIRAAAEAAPRIPGMHVVIAGHGPEEESLGALAASLGVNGAVRLLGRRDDVPDLLAAVDVAVCCSEFEGSPLSVMEYMAAGRPVVVTRVGGLPDLVHEGVHGLVVPPADPGALASALERLASDPAGRATMGAAASERQRDEFALDVLVRRVEDLYDELFARTSRARAERWQPASRVNTPSPSR